MTAIETITNLGPQIFSRLLERVLKLPPAYTRELLVTKNLEIPMRDGVVLLADRYAPRSASGGGPHGSQGTLPTVLVRSPYGKGAYTQHSSGGRSPSEDTRW